MASAVAVLSMIVGGLATLAVAVMLLASMPNSSPQQLRELNLWLASVVVAGIGGLGGGIWALVVHRPWLSAGLGLAPAAYGVGLLVLLTLAHR